jgi:phage minor structural protein
MILYFLDRKMNTVGVASSSLPKTPQIYDDVLRDDIETASRTLKFSLAYTDANAGDVAEMSAEGNFIVYQNRFFTIIDSDIDTESMAVEIYCEDGGLDLLNDSFPPMEDGVSRTLSQWLLYFAGGSGFEVGTCESSASLALVFSDSGTATERLQAVAEAFDVELDFSFLMSDFALAGKYISAYKRKGLNQGVILRDGIEYSNLRIKRSVANLATALRPEGNDGLAITESVYDDGDIYTVNGSDVLYCRSAIGKYGRPGGTNKAITGSFKVDTSSRGQLLAESVEELKRRSIPTVIYECDLVQMPFSAGDYIRIVSEKYNIYDTVRVISTEVSESNNEFKAEFSREV